MKKFILFFTFLSNSILHASTIQDQFLKVYKEYKQGNYQEVLTLLKPLENNSKTRGKSLYWQSLCYTKLQEYDLANQKFKRAIKYSKQPKDIFYEYGQSLYASNELNEARKLFAKSLKERFKPDTSLYYVSYISQLKEEYDRAIKYYKSLESNDSADKSISQAASMQIGEIYHLKFKKEKKPPIYIKDVVIPQFETAYKIASNSTVATDIQNKIRELKRKHGFDGVKLLNGKKLPENPWKVRFNQSFIYDSNVTLLADDSTESATDHDDIYSKTQLDGSYLFSAARVFTFKPGLQISNSFYSDRETPDLHQNDSYTITGSLKNAVEHLVFKRQAAILLDFDYAYTAKDHTKTRSLDYYTRSWSLAAGQRLKLFEKIGDIKFGDTTLKLKKKYTTNTDVSANSITETVNLSQTLIFPNKQITIFTFNLDKLDSDTATSSTTTYLLRLDYIGPKIWGFGTQAGFGYSIVDTKFNRPSRGVEHKYNPSIEINKEVFKNFQLSGKYAYTRNTSDAKATNQYYKNELTFDMQYKFQ